MNPMLMIFFLGSTLVGASLGVSKVTGMNHDSALLFFLAALAAAGEFVRQNGIRTPGAKNQARPGSVRPPRH